MEITTLLEYSERSQLRAWLQENHSKEKECWVVMSRSKTPPPGILPYIDVVEEALCFGWIDSTLNGVLAVLQDEAKGRYVVEIYGKQPVGSLMLTREWSDWNCCWYLWIQSVYVRPEYRNRGIYRSMYNEVLKLAKSEGISQVRLYVDKDNLKAQKVYEKSGMSRCHYLMYEVEV